MSKQLFYIIKKIPLLRPLVALCIGIVTGYHLQPAVLLLLQAAVAALIIAVALSLFSNYQKFKYGWLQGLVFYTLFIVVGCLLSIINNENNSNHSLTQYAAQPKNVLVTLQEPITVKEKSYKSVAKTEAVWQNNQWQQASGKVLLYFKKQDSLPQLHYGSQIIITDNLQSIGNAGNPGTFNYREYCLFQGVVKQAFLSKKDYLILNSEKKFFLQEWVLRARDKMLQVLRGNISNKYELSIAEALLIGYRDDLDRDLTQAYSNTGVVHIIAISGLHLGMIYALLVFLFKPFRKYKAVKIIKPVTILFVLWGFSFIAGAAPSILRSAVMFSFIVVGESFGKRSNIYNNLAASAFVILLINPFSLWDVGFQLSYSAVLSIVIFSKHINGWFYFKNKLLKYIWGLNAVTLSAQILTLPFVLYHFHQFPVLFLFTNMLAVPLSCIVLFLELGMLCFAWWPAAVQLLGVITGGFIAFLNNFILHINNLPFAVWKHLQLNIPQAILLLPILLLLGSWLVLKHSKALLSGICLLALFFAIRCADFVKREQQQKIIVYNVPQHIAIDIVQGRDYQFIGDSILKEDGFLRNFHLQPSRIKNRISPTGSLQNISVQPNLIQSSRKNILLINTATIQRPLLQQKIKVDVVVISGNPKLYLKHLMNYIECSVIVADASNPLWKINKWKKDAEQLHLRLHSIPDDGAFEMNL